MKGSRLNLTQSITQGSGTSRVAVAQAPILAHPFDILFHPRIGTSRWATHSLLQHPCDPGRADLADIGRIHASA